ncbi:MAG: serine protease [Actinophytocola sp.]|uniref:SSI family serine proteinase inhibitor n=1 Tax=Actinophytocola sp. TaxID=1872138 RepID=UPI001329E554|nr:SSI family serine proteinase inhibitor [Actinophytocola sp.]MPZ81996.1 serine protease [Actinophytocola sp.]
MTSFRLSGTVLAVAALLSTAVLTGTASADDKPRSTLILRLATPDGASSTVRLECDPAGGSHPNAKPACDEVSVAGGDFDELPGTPQLTACTMEYRPVVASVRGRWEGMRVRWTHEYSNSCTLRVDTGVVFAF